MTEPLYVIEGTVTAECASRQVRDLCDSDALQPAQPIYYPYHAFRAACTVATLIGRQERQLHCLVDAMNGQGATAEPFTTRLRVAAASEQMQPDISPTAAHAVARRTVSHHLGKALRMIAAFDIKLEAEGLVWKQFWVVGSTQYSVLVDSTNGAMHPLRSKAG